MATRILIFMMMALAIVRCKDTETFHPDPQAAKFNASAFVEVRDVNGLPMEGVEINLGSKVEYTDEDGVVYLKDVTMENSTYVTAKLSGYFHGSRRFYPMPNRTEFVKIILLSFNAIGSIQSADGGIVNLTDGTTVQFPSNAIADLNGNEYNGTVSISAQPLNAGDPDLSYKMPGDLIGDKENGDRGSLASMGMVAVEMRSSTGDLLQVKNGSKVEIRMHVPATMISNAPSTIPMWYFDEATGFWKEQGQATLDSNTYIAQVGHFSYWNYDAWFPAVKWGGTFVYADGSPASQVQVCISILSLATTKCAYTNEAGVVCGLVAANELLLMEVQTPCGETILSQQIGPFSDSTMTGPYTIPSTSLQLTSISGTAVNCDGDPVTNGYVKIRLHDVNYYTVTDLVTGAFDLTLINCSESEATIKAVDVTAIKQSLPLTFAFAPVINTGAITVCEAINEFIDIEVTGYADHVVFLLPSVNIQTTHNNISASDSTQVGYKYFYAGFDGSAPGTYTTQAFEVAFELPGTNTYVYRGNSTLTVEVTYYGGPGDYILGNVSGTVSTGPNNGNIEYPFTGTFSVLRE
ncbi:MAG: hypothetical protein ABJB16_03240 [Saprospiraceae bacterium]